MSDTDDEVIEVVPQYDRVTVDVYDDWRIRITQDSMLTDHKVVLVPVSCVDALCDAVRMLRDAMSGIR